VIRLRLGFGQMLKANDRDLRQAKVFCCLMAAVAGDNLPVFVDQDRGIETEGINAFGDRPHLCPVVVPGVARVWDEIGKSDEFQLPLGESCSARDGSDLSSIILRSVRLGSG